MSDRGLPSEYLPPEEETVSEVTGTPAAKTLAELKTYRGDDPSELLRHRYLCRGGGLLLVGPTGIGKSSFSMQAMIVFALGKALFGIEPAKPLKSLLIQAENDEGDLAEMRDGVIAGLNLKSEDAGLATENVIVVREDSRTGMRFFTEVVEPLLKAHRPDLLWIDPALAYLGAEASSQKDVSAFLRNMLNPLLHRHQCGCVVVHHTNKPPSGKEKPTWSAGDLAYLGSGSIEWANWARAVMALRSVGSQSVFELCAAKRGGRLRWKAGDGVTAIYSRLIAHGSTGGCIYWREAEAGEAPAEPKAKRIWTKDDLLPHVPAKEPIPKEVLRSRANVAGIPINKINPLLAELIHDEKCHVWRIKRARTNPQVLIARFPQPEEELKV